MTVNGSALAQVCISGAKGTACWIAKARLETELEIQYTEIHPKKLCSTTLAMYEYT